MSNPNSPENQIGQALLAVFGHVFIINLKERADRRREINAQLALIGLDLDHPAITIFDAVRPGDVGDWPSLGARGCFMSHLGVLDEAQKRGLDRILILEDDVDWTRQFLAEGADVLSGLANDDWHFVHGGLDGAGSAGPPKLVPVAAERGLLQTHFIGLAGQGIPRALAYLSAMAARPAGDPAGGPMHVDGAYGWFRRENADIAALLCDPPIARQRASRTDIHDANWYDRFALTRPIVSALRRLKNMFRS